MHHIFRQLSTELRGDSVASSQLYAAYQKQRCCVYKLLLDEAVTKKYSVLDKMQFNTKQAQGFRRRFDMLCKNAFINCLTRWNDYTQPIILDEDFIRYQEVAKQVFELHEFPLSFERSATQAHVFKTLLQHCVFGPGDWHTGMNSLQSIYKIFWDPLLKPMKEHLRWKNIRKDVRDCYYQASSLVTLMNRELNRAFLHEFISENYPNYKQTMESDDTVNDADVVCQIAIDFQAHIESLKTAKDEYV